MQGAPSCSHLRALLTLSLSTVAGTSITWNGKNHKMDGNGAYWWDGKAGLPLFRCFGADPAIDLLLLSPQGSNGGRTKPRPMFKVKFSGTMSNVYLLVSLPSM